MKHRRLLRNASAADLANQPYSLTNWESINLSKELYQKFAATYCDSEPQHIWAAIDTMMDLFHQLALAVGTSTGQPYPIDDELGARQYLNQVRASLDRPVT